MQGEDIHCKLFVSLLCRCASIVCCVCAFAALLFLAVLFLSAVHLVFALLLLKASVQTTSQQEIVTESAVQMHRSTAPCSSQASQLTCHI